eukprot:11605375-Alexandrium_andersonii.AAC.1
MSEWAGARADFTAQAHTRAPASSTQACALRCLKTAPTTAVGKPRTRVIAPSGWTGSSTTGKARIA